MKPNSWQIPIAAACFVLGILIVLQFQAQERQGFPQANPRSDEKRSVATLVQSLNQLEADRDRFQAEVNRLRSQMQEFEKTAGQSSDLLRAMQDQVEQARMQAGLLVLHGPGIVVRLNDSPRKPREGEDPWFFIVHDVDLQSLVNELWASGAEAVAINDQRLVSRSSIRCVGPTVLVNTQRLSPPYVVKAIGPARDMERALRMTGGFLDTLAPSLYNGVEVTITAARDLRVPAYRGAVGFSFARPVKAKER